jgi:hypothetical protein
LRITIKATHYNLEFGPEEVPGAAFNGLLEAIRQGFPVANDIIDAIVRDCCSNALAQQEKPKQSVAGK